MKFQSPTSFLKSRSRPPLMTQVYTYQSQVTKPIKPGKIDTSCNKKTCSNMLKTTLGHQTCNEMSKKCSAWIIANKYHVMFSITHICQIIIFFPLEETTTTPRTIAPWYEEYDYADCTFAPFQSFSNCLYQRAWICHNVLNVQNIFNLIYSLWKISGGKEAGRRAGKSKKSQRGEGSVNQFNVC